MNTQTTYTKLCGILQDLQIFEPRRSIPRETVLLGQGGIMDSLTAMAFITAVEKEFDMDIIENDMNFSALESLEALIHFLTQANG